MGRNVTEAVLAQGVTVSDQCVENSAGLVVFRFVRRGTKKGGLHNVADPPRLCST